MHFVNKCYKINIEGKGNDNMNIHTYIHTYIHTFITKNIKNNFLNYNYNKIRFYRKIIDTGTFYSIYKKLLQGGII